MEQQFCAFISYRHQSPDQEIAKKLHTAIETYHIPGSIRKKTGRKRLGRVFRDQEELPLSPDLGSDIEAALDRSEWLIAICSPRYLESRWCLRELEYFIQHKGRDRVLAVLAEGTPETSFPELLRFETDENGLRRETEPLAANVCAPGLGQQLKLLKGEQLRLLAPMLGVGYDDLKRRARQRKLRTIAVGAAAALVIAAGTGTYLSINHARNEALKREAEEQQRIAAEQARLAEEQQRLAEERRLLAEQERLSAVSNSIGEYLEKAASARIAGEKRSAAGTLLEALALSDINDAMRRGEILSQLRRTMYIEPYSPVAGFTNQNVRLMDLVPSPDGSKAVGVENSNSAALIDFGTGEVAYRVSVGNTQIGSLLFSPDGERFCAICDQGRLAVVWNTADGSEAFRYVSRQDKQYHIANALFWRDGDTLLVQDMERFLFVSSDGTEKLLYTMGDMQDWYSYDDNIYTILYEKPMDEIFTFREDLDDYTGTQVVVSEDWSKILISGNNGATGTLIIDENGQLVCPLYGMPGTVFEHYTLSPDGRRVACRSYTGLMFQWDAQTGDMVTIDYFDPAQGESSDIVFSPDSSRMAFVAADTLYCVDPWNEIMLFSGAVESTNIVPELIFSRDGRTLFLTAQNLYIIDAQTGALLRMDAADFSSTHSGVIPMEDTVFISRSNGDAYLYSLPGLASVRETESFSGELCPEYDAADMPAQGWDTDLRQEHELTEAFLTTAGTINPNPQLRFSRDGMRAALLYPDGVIELFDREGDGSVLAMIGQLTTEITGFGMTEDRLVASDASGRLLIYDLGTLSVQTILNLEVNHYRFAFSPDGDMLMALDWDGNIDVFSLSEGEKLFSMTSPAGFNDFGFSADGAWAVGYTPNGCVLGDLWRDESALIVAAEHLAGPAD